MDMENKINALCEMQGSLISCLKGEFDRGISDVDSGEAGSVTDMIKDLFQAEKYARESFYYKKVTEAMEEKENDHMGYNPRVRGNISYGYKPMVDQEPYISGYLNDPDFDRNMHKGYGKPYTEYMDAKRHYTSTGSSNDKSRMDMKAREHMDQTIETIEDIWKDASPELKQKMKNDIKNLYDSIM